MPTSEITLQCPFTEKHGLMSNSLYWLVHWRGALRRRKIKIDSVNIFFIINFFEVNQWKHHIADVLGNN
jgi:hypothetical protein